MMNSLAFKNEQKFEIPNAKFDNIHKIHLIEFVSNIFFAQFLLCPWTSLSYQKNYAQLYKNCQSNSLLKK